MFCGLRFGFPCEFRCVYVVKQRVPDSPKEVEDPTKLPLVPKWTKHPTKKSNSTVTLNSDEGYHSGLTNAAEGSFGASFKIFDSRPQDLGCQVSPDLPKSEAQPYYRVLQL